MALDIVKAQIYAAELEKLLSIYGAKNSDVHNLHLALRPFLEAAQKGTVHQPYALRDIPGSHYVNEGNLRQYRDLEEALAHFRLALTDIEIPPLLKGASK